MNACSPLGSICFHRLHSYYETVRLLLSHRVVSSFHPYTPLVSQGRCIASLHRTWEPAPRIADLPGMQWFLLCARHALRPRRTKFILAITNKPCCLRLTAEYRLPLNKLTRLNHFTIARYGSHTPMPTLKPNLTVSAPRLCTGC